MTYRLGIDIGTNSLGWCILRLGTDGAPEALVDMGVRIYQDGRNPKDRQSLAVARRQARSVRRRRDRYLRRRRNLLRTLIRSGLMPEDPVKRKKLERLDPYELRARGVEEKLSPHELGRALFHLNQRRGFKSNRRAEGGKDDETGKVREGVARLQAAMKEVGAKTVGAFFHEMRKSAPDASHVPSIRARLKRLDPEAKQDAYPFYPSRELIEDEFEQLWAVQARHRRKLLTDELKTRIHHIIFHQRPLKPPAVGKCLFLPEERRLPRAHPLFQRFRILQELNNLRVIDGLSDRPLRKDERDKLLEMLLRKQKLTFVAMRKALELPARTHFNLESGNRKHLDGDLTAYRIERGTRKRPGMGSAWRALDERSKAGLVERLLEESDEDSLVEWLIATYDLDESIARNLTRTQLPDGHAALGPTAMTRIVAALEADVIPYNEAVIRAGFPHHSQFDHDGGGVNLPYYGEVLDRHIVPGTGDPDDFHEDRIGRLTNPTVHIGLNQLRRLINRLIEQHGKPAEITVELARELKQNKKQREEAKRKQKLNQERHEEAGKLFKEVGAFDTGENRLRHRLWLEQDKTCPYTGSTISARQLFSSEVDIDHILPFSRTLDNSPANKVVCLREANRDKRNKSPYEAWSHTPGWAAIEANAQRLPPNKRWRFAADAMERFENEERDFLDRHLVETRYLGKLAREYLTVICKRVWVTPGQLTALIRGKLGLNDLLGGHNLPETIEGARKNRDDHRHHAIDAFVVAITDPGYLNRMAREAARSEREAFRTRMTPPEPFEGYRQQLREALDRLVVSHRPDHAKKGRLHNDTAFGLVRPIKDDLWEVVTRKPIDSFKSVKDIEKIRDPLIRETLLERCYDLSGKELAAALDAYARETGTRRVRVIEPLSVIPIPYRSGTPYKAYKGDANHRIEIWRLPDGRWVSQTITMFEANQPTDGPPRRPHPAAKLIMRLFKNDMIAVGEGKERRILRVVKFSKGSIYFADHREGGNLKARDADKSDPFKYAQYSASTLKKLRARKLRIDETGRVWDPGPLET